MVELVGGPCDGDLVNWQHGGDTYRIPMGKSPGWAARGEKVPSRGSDLHVGYYRRVASDAAQWEGYE